jgi:hypothetical protein
MSRFKTQLIFAGVMALLTIVGSIVTSRDAIAQGQGSAPVIINGPLPLPVQVSPTQRPFQIELCSLEGTLAGCEQVGTAKSSFLVGSEPLVIEYVSGRCNAYGPGTVTNYVLSLRTVVGPPATSFPVGHVLHTSPAPLGFDLYRSVDVAEQTRIYASPNSTVSVLGAAGGGGSMLCSIKLSGYTLAP